MGASSVAMILTYVFIIFCFLRDEYIFLIFVAYASASLMNFHTWVSLLIESSHFTTQAVSSVKGQ